jgi:hypothetical protein
MRLRNSDSNPSSSQGQQKKDYILRPGRPCEFPTLSLSLGKHQKKSKQKTGLLGSDRPVSVPGSLSLSLSLFFSSASALFFFFFVVESENSELPSYPGLSHTRVQNRTVPTDPVLPRIWVWMGYVCACVRAWVGVGNLRSACAAAGSRRSTCVGTYGNTGWG